MNKVYQPLGWTTLTSTHKTFGVSTDLEEFYNVIYYENKTEGPCYNFIIKKLMYL
jgi:hypothetical protein